jgi:nucleotide-binding universal stress UspA family protein
VSKRILHATDFSRASRPAFKKALAMAKANRATLELLHVLAPVMALPADGYVSPQTYDALTTSATAWAQKEMGRLVKAARAGGVRARGALVEGAAHDRIVRAARSLRPEVVVMGTHGRTGLPRLLLGSVAARVIASAPCPVLTVRGN